MRVFSYVVTVCHKNCHRQGLSDVTVTVCVPPLKGVHTVTRHGGGRKVSPAGIGKNFPKRLERVEEPTWSNALYWGRVFKRALLGSTAHLVKCALLGSSFQMRFTGFHRFAVLACHGIAVLGSGFRRNLVLGSGFRINLVLGSGF